MRIRVENSDQENLDISIDSPYWHKLPCVSNIVAFIVKNIAKIIFLHVSLVIKLDSSHVEI